MTQTKSTFEVDKKGLAKLLERKGKHFALLELFQNSVDEDGVTHVHLGLNPEPAPDRYRLIVSDNSPEGFKDMAHAYTLFAESAKKNRVDQRGRFNLGEKLVIAICEEAKVETTKGTITFTEAGRVETDEHTDAGSVFTGILKMTPAEAKAAEAAVHTLIVPPGIKATFNGTILTAREPVRTFEVTLRTEMADDEGYLRPTRRKTKVNIYEPREGETACLYEMGIPVVETDDRWHVDIAQKVPLNSDRDNVPPGYLRDVRVAVLNHAADLIGDAGGKWIDDALEDEDAEADAVAAVIKGRYGDKAVIADATDPEGTKIAMSKGYTVIPGGSFSKDAWKQVKSSKAVLPAGQVTPSPNPNIGDDQLDLLAPEHWPEGVKQTAAYAKALALTLLGAEIEVRITADITWPYAATYGPTHGGKGGLLTLGYGRLGHAWFSKGRHARMDALLIHEFAHHKVSDHLTAAFYDECCRVGSDMVQLALDHPSIFEDAFREAVAA